jgi:hypothetical protein
MAAAVSQVGQCVENQHFASNGDAQQKTTGGLLAWRKADNWTAFTDGFHTWVNGPRGIQQRLNTERFAWETGSANYPIAGTFLDLHGSGLGDTQTFAAPPVWTLSYALSCDYPSNFAVIGYTPDGGYITLLVNKLVNGGNGVAVARTRAPAIYLHVSTTCDWRIVGFDDQR